MARTTSKGHPSASAVQELPMHAGSGDILMNEDVEDQLPSGKRPLNANIQNDDYPTPTSVDDAQGTRQAPKLSESTSEAIEHISKEPRKLLNAINEITLLGIDRNVQLPKIVAIGDQSAGKSSVIAAISGITVPRKAGLCTRCPLHIDLISTSEEEAWTCTVTIENHYELKGGKWSLYDEPVESFFAKVAQGDLEDILVRAQSAILNPASDHRHFANCSPNDLDLKERQVEFSPNLIHLNISGPNCPNLTFYDLPGVFNQAAKKEHQHLPGTVRKLVQKYIDPESHIVLLACSMESDIENSTAASLVEKVKHRCIGLLTKPDRLAPGDPIDSLRSILQGNTFKLGHGYFVTKQPSQADLNTGIDHKQALEAEIEFFKTWKPELEPFAHRFGTGNLQAQLSKLLVKHIREVIPVLSNKVHKELERIHIPPEPPGDKSLSIVLKITSNIHNKLGQHLQGELPHNAFIRLWMDLSQKFSEALHKSRPTLVISSHADREARFKLRRPTPTPTRTEAISVDDSDDDERVPVQKKRPATGPSTPSPTKRQRTQQNGHAPPTSSQRNGHAPSPQQSSSFGSSSTGDIVNKFSLEYLHKIRLEQNTSAIGTHDHRADEHLILQSINWQIPLDEFINETESLIEKMVNSLLDEELGQWKNMPLSSELRDHVSGYIDGLVKRHQELAYRLLESEKIKPMSLNQNAINLNVQQETKIFQDARRIARADLYLDEKEQKTGKFTSGAERQEKIRKLDDADLGSDEYAQEIETMGRVRGYYNVASASFVDTICKTMRLDVFETLRKGLQVSIEKKFKLTENGGFEECKRLLAEDAETAQLRKHLLNKKERYEKAKASLDKLVG